MIPVLHGVWAAAGGLVGDFEHIETQTVGAGGAASVTFSSIPGTYKHLQIRATLQAENSTDGWGFLAQCNSDTTYTNYRGHYLYGNGGTAGSGSVQSASWPGLYCYAINGNSTAATFSAFVLDIVDYASTSKYKTSRVITGYDVNGAGDLALASSLWMSTAAISGLTFKISAGHDFSQHSTFALYGVK